MNRILVTLFAVVVSYGHNNTVKTPVDKIRANAGWYSSETKIVDNKESTYDRCIRKNGGPDAQAQCTKEIEAMSPYHFGAKYDACMLTYNNPAACSALINPYYYPYYGLGYGSWGR